MTTTIRVICALSLALAGCGGESDLSSEAVTSIPDGDGTGSARSGSYAIQLNTTSCSGQCPAIDLGWFKLTLCKQGARVTGSEIVGQQNGHLEVQINSSAFYVKDLKGGVNKDGAFDVGGVDQQQGKEYDVTITARVNGTISAGGVISGQARAKGSGSAYGDQIACQASYALSGQRK